MPIIPASKKAEIGSYAHHYTTNASWRQRLGGSLFKASQFSETQSQLINWVWWYTPVSPATWEAVGGRITVQAGL
jgi:hypothetical protein